MRFPTAVVVLHVLMAVFTPMIALQADFSENNEHWEKARKAMDKGLPRTAIEHIEPVIERALRDGRDAEAIHAITLRIALKGTIQGNRPEEKISMLDREIEKAPDSIRPVMETIQAYWHWNYFRQNRWRFLQRTASGSEVEDITEWDLQRIIAEIDRRFYSALSHDEFLKEIPIEEYDDLLEKGTMPDRYRPTLYDFIAACALDFYGSGEQAAAHPQEAFILHADTALFEGTEDFLNWEVERTDIDSPLYKAVIIYQDLLRFHRNTGNQNAFTDWDLDRLRFAYNHAVGEDRIPRYKDALRKFIQSNEEHETAARAYHDLAAALLEKDEPEKAHETAGKGAKRFPESPGGKQCRQLLSEIEARSASIEIERVWNEAEPVIRVRYRNVDEIHFRLVEVDFKDRLMTMQERRTGHPEVFQQDELKELLEEDPVLSWSKSLPETSDFRERVEDLAARADINPGFHVLIASHNREFRAYDNVLSHTPVWISGLAVVIRTDAVASGMDGLVLDAVTGSPIPNARVRAWAYNWNTPLKELDAVSTDNDGYFNSVGSSGRRHVLMAEYNGDMLATASGYSTGERALHDDPLNQTVFFTDRAIYRPGQIIRFKGICVRMDRENDNYAVMPSHDVTVRLMDVNNEEIDRIKTRTNDYGSFSGSFTAPRDRLTGRMTIEADPAGSTGISVEEYRRPTFEVVMKSPETSPRLSGSVFVEGKATAFTGAAKDNSAVRWRVVREARFPVWRPWVGQGPGSDHGQEIAHGVTHTDSDGTFAIEFKALPDPAIPERDDPVFTYTIHADVTDSAGETGSALHTISAGYTALFATLKAGEWLVDQEPFILDIHTASPDGVGRKAEGTIRIHELQTPDRVKRPPLPGARRYDNSLSSRRQTKHTDSVTAALHDPANWTSGAAVLEYAFDTDNSGKGELELTLESGAYRAVLETHDRYGEVVRAEHPIIVISPSEQHFTIPQPYRVGAPAWTVYPGDTFTALWGSGYDKAQAFIEIEHRGEILQRYWTDPSQTQSLITQEVDESMRGDFFARVTMVRENRAYMEQYRIIVPRDDMELEIKWNRFVSKLEPGERETWTAEIRWPDDETRSAEMAATLYDRALDSFVPHEWPGKFNGFRKEQVRIRSNFENRAQRLQPFKGNWHVESRAFPITYRSFPEEITGYIWGYRVLRGRTMQLGDSDGMLMAADADTSMESGISEFEESVYSYDIDLDQIHIRKHLQETAFFFPHIDSDEDGIVSMTFTMPEALTEWKFMGFAHDTDLRSGLLTGSAVTSKDLMVQPNPPRFLREGDELEFTVLIFNQAPVRQKGSVRLSFYDAETDDSMDAALGNVNTDQTFDIPPKESREASWRIKVPEGTGYLVYRSVASSERHSDGEEAYLPVLSRRILVTETLPFTIRGSGTRSFKFDALIASKDSETLENIALTVQTVSNPSWHAVMALPYLMEFPHNSSEQIFNRFYANALGYHIANSDPNIRRMFDLWKNTPALESPLEKNESLKSVALEETPWIRQAEDESRARRNLGVLFDGNRMEDEISRALFQLTKHQYEDGAWPWFPGGRPDNFITMYITTGFGRLLNMGVDLDKAPAIKAVGYLDSWIHEVYENIKPVDRDGNHLSPRIALYLYCRSFFIEDQPVAPRHHEAVDYFIDQAGKQWLSIGHLQSQAHIAMALHRLGEIETAEDIMRSLRERAVTDEDSGMFWRDLEHSWWWYRAPIETQALMIEAFEEVMRDSASVEECRIWLLNQKRARDWKTTKATADAVYAILQGGTDMAASDDPVKVSMGDYSIEQDDIEAGTGFFERRFTGSEIKPDMGYVRVDRRDEGMAWGALYWQYLEDIDRVSPSEDTPLTINKTIHRKIHTRRGPELAPIDGFISQGEELVVRIVLRADRDMEYMHMKDYRGSGIEPVNVLSGHRHQDGLRYYETTRDTASHFFIDYLPKGTYVFEYPVRARHRGKYDSGTASIQCMYAPEFSSTSESIEMKIK